MSKGEIVRISHRELSGLSQENSRSNKDRKTESNDDSSRRRRPAMPLYQPRMRRSEATTTPVDDSPQSGDPHQVNDQHYQQASQSSKGQKKSRKPDLQRYIPRYRMQGAVEEKQVQGSEDWEDEVRPKEEERKADGGQFADAGNETEEKTQAKRGPNRGEAKSRGRGRQRGVTDCKARKTAPRVIADPTTDGFDVTKDNLEWDYLEVNQGNITSQNQQREPYWKGNVSVEVVKPETKNFHNVGDKTEENRVQGTIQEQIGNGKNGSRLTQDVSDALTNFQGTLVITNSKFDTKEPASTKQADKSDQRQNASEFSKQHNRTNPSKPFTTKPHEEPSRRPARYSDTKPRRMPDTDHDNNRPQIQHHDSPDIDNHRGVIHLPPSVNTELVTEAPPSAPLPRGRGRSRGSHRMLYDPNNPSKPRQVPTNQPGGLRFYDQQSSPESYSPQYHPGYPPPHMEREYTVVGSPQGGGMMQRPDYSHPAIDEGVGDSYASDPYYHSEPEKDMKSSSRAHNRAQAESVLRDAGILDSQLSNLLSRRIPGQQGWTRLLNIRRELEIKYEQVVLLDPDLSNKHNVEQLLWRSTYYQVIEVLRKQLSGEEEEKDESSAHRLLSLLQEGTTFYESLLEKLQSRFGFVLDDYLEPSLPPSDCVSRSVKLALLSCQRCLISLGDIARYKEQTNHTSNYGKARSWYLKAQQIAPKNGRPYNQLAILAFYTRRKLDAVYYYMRSLAASNPFLNSRECIISLFNEARKKAELTEKKRIAEQAMKKHELEKERKTSNYGNGHRIEIWTSLDGRDDRLSGSEDELTQLSDAELNKRFVLSFLNVHGKLFTKIGMETYEECRWQALRELDQLLLHTPVPIGNARMLQLMAINMFAVDNTAPKDIVLEEGCRSLHQENAVCLGLDMFACLVHRSTHLLKQHASSGDFQILNEDLRQLIPSVRVWCDWMTCHEDLWNPPPSPCSPQYRPEIDVWEAIAAFCDTLKTVDTSYVKLYSHHKEGCEPVILPEDAQLAGFVPLMGRPQATKFVHSTVDKEVARDCVRVEQLAMFADYLCGIEPPLLLYNVHTHSYQSCVTTDTIDDTYHSSNILDLSIEEQQEMEAEVMEDDGGDEDHVRDLRQRKHQLQRQLQHQEQHEQSVRAVLEGGSGRPLEVHVTPRLLVPDTNCLIDHLPTLQALLNTRQYVIIVPLVVICELDGLSLGGVDDHTQMVASHASLALHYLEGQFAAKNNYLRALTSKGNVLENINFRSEDMTDKRGNNDDLILACCLHYCQDKARNFMPDNHDGAIRLEREVVLLTDDRNLHLKAHMRNVPVRSLPWFSRWAKVS